MKKIFKLEKKHHPLASRAHFAKRLLLWFALACFIVTFGLGWGVWGYHRFAGLSWLDALLNAAMILTGMGPVDVMPNEAAKLFAAIYALFSGVVFLSAMAVVLSPIFHRILHQFHVDEFDDAAVAEKKNRQR